MPTILIGLKDISLDLDKQIDWNALSEEEAISLIKRTYQFLSSEIEVSIVNGIATITLPEEKAQRAEEALKWYSQGTRQAEQGDYKRAAHLFERVLERLPNHIEARRDLAMAHLEMGNIEQAKRRLIQVLNLAPKDAWSYVLLANLYAKHEKDLERAEKWYRKAYELNPQDAILLTNYGALMIEKGNREQAEEFFERAIAANPDLPNSYYSLALLNLQDSKPAQTLEILQDLFVKTHPVDVRSAPLYAEARRMYLEANKTLAEKTYDEMMAFIEEEKQALERQTGHHIVITEDHSLDVSAITQMAWKYGREEHRIKYRAKSRLVTPHLLAHELVHITLEDAARKAGRNRTFTTNARTEELAARSLGDSTSKLRQMGLPQPEIKNILQRLISGLANQLLNMPLDMVIEHRLFHDYRVLRPSQFLSLHATATENVDVLNNKEIRRMTPPRIFRANTTMNAAYALFMDWLYEGSTEYAAPYKKSDGYPTAQQLFGIWRNQKDTMEPGDEYDFVDEFARVLKLESWYQWRKEASEQEERSPMSVFEELHTTSPQGPTNPELLKQKESATVMYLLNTLERFDKMTEEEIKQLGMEVGIRGMEGIDYTSSEEQYTVRAFPGETFSGLQMLCFMYVAFKHIDPTVDTGLDFEEAYQAALQMFRAKGQ